MHTSCASNGSSRSLGPARASGCAGFGRRGIALLFFLLASLAGAQEPEETRGAPAESADAPEIRAEIAAAEKRLAAAPDRAAVLYFLASSHALLHETLPALKLLKECLAAKEGFDPSGDSAFGELRTSRDFQLLVEQVHKDFPPVHLSKIAFTTIERDLFPEGLAYDPGRDSFYLGSLHQKKIVRIVRGDRPNDLVVLRSGAVYLTDTVRNEVYRFDARSSSFRPVPLAYPLVFPNGIALTDDERFLYVADQFGVLRVDLNSLASAPVGAGRGTTLAGIDGLYWRNGSLVAVQNGIGTPRVAVFRLSADGLAVLKTTVLENFLKTPTTGALCGDEFYFIVNTEIDNLNGEHILDVTKLKPVVIARVRLP